MNEVASRTYRIKNAIVTIHGYSAGTAILNITSTHDAGAQNHASIWVSPDELKELANAFNSFPFDGMNDIQKNDGE